jgi:hypothetical protein
MDVLYRAVRHIVHVLAIAQLPDIIVIIMVDIIVLRIARLIMGVSHFIRLVLMVAMKVVAVHIADV